MRLQQRAIEIQCPLCHCPFLVERREEEYLTKCPYCQAELLVRLPTADELTRERSDKSPTSPFSHSPTPSVVPSPAQQLRSLTRYSDVTLPREAEVGVSIALVVRVTVKPVSPEAKKLELQVPEGERMVEVTVIAHPNGLELMGSNLRRLRVPLTADSDPVHFELAGKQVGAASVTVGFFQHERYLGSVTADTYVKAVGEVIHANPTPTRGTFSLAERWEDPDLLIRIYEIRSADGAPRYRFELTSHKLGLFHKDMGEVALPQRAEMWMDEQMKTLTGWARDLSAASDKLLARFGVDLYDHLCPPELKDFYWKALDKREDIETALMITSEPWVPWEMVKPFQRVGNDIVEAPHWCERFVMGRWLNGQPPPLTLPRGEVAVIAPRSVGVSAQKEVDMLKRIGLSVREVPARLKDVLEFLESDGCPGVHAVSHGIFNLSDCDQAELWLEKPSPHDDPEKLYPKLINGRGLQFGKSKPLAFLNACNCGRSDFTYWGLGGWAKAMVLRAECSAFLAPFWEIEDNRALECV